MISSLAVVETDQVGENVRIGAFAVVSSDVVLGRDVVIHPHVVIAPGVTIGNGVEVFPGAFIGKEPKGAGALARTPHFERRLKVAENCSIGPHAILYYDIEIGPGTLIGDGVSIREQCRIGARCVVGRYVTLNYAVTVGDRTKIMDHAWLAGNMTVGSDVFLSGGVLTANDNAIGLTDYREEEMQGPTFEDGAAIGVGAVVLPGVRVGKAALVGAGAVVTHDVEAGSVVMGVPARSVRREREKNR